MFYMMFLYTITCLRVILLMLYIGVGLLIVGHKPTKDYITYSLLKILDTYLDEYEGDFHRKVEKALKRISKE